MHSMCVCILLVPCVLWPPHAKCWVIGKDSDAGRDWWQEEKGTTEDEMAGWHHGLNGHESEWTPGDGDQQGGLASCNSWGRKELDTIEGLNSTELIHRSVKMVSIFVGFSFSYADWWFPLLCIRMYYLVCCLLFVFLISVPVFFSSGSFF